MLKGQFDHLNCKRLLHFRVQLFFYRSKQSIKYELGRTPPNYYMDCSCKQVPKNYEMY